MTLADDCINYGRLVTRWIFGLIMAGLGVYMIVAKIAVWPAIGLLAFGVFILRPADLKDFANWFRANASDFLKPPGGTP